MSGVDVESIERARQFLYREARLLDDRQLEEWLELFHPDGLYWVPIDEHAAPEDAVALILDDRLRREERVFHQLHVPAPSLRPLSGTVHHVTNVEIVARTDDRWTVRSNLLLNEMRSGDFSQVGIGEVRTLVASVHHVLEEVGDSFLIHEKRVLLMDRRGPHPNMMFII